MSGHDRGPIRILVTDDEPAVLEAFRSIFGGTLRPARRASSDMAALRDKLFGPALALSSAIASAESFAPTYADGAEAAVRVVREALDQGQPFAVIFLDMRMPPGPDGVWAAMQIRALDPNVDIVIVTAYSDVDPQEISAKIPPVEKIFYVPKPFHPQEIRQLALALGRKWQAEIEIRKLAYYDPLTGLPNRAFAQARLAQAIELARRHDRPLAVLYLDIDNFKRINDTLGHRVGDQLLKITAERLVGSLRASDTVARGTLGDELHNVARLGGDEFIVILSEIRRSEDASTVAVRIIANLTQPMRLLDHEVVVTPSIGISVFPQDGQDGETLLRSADMAMYFVKRNGHNGFHFFNESMNEVALKRLTLENQLRKALEQGEFSIDYQPQLDLLTGEITGMEALLRWRNPALGQVPPLEFIPVAEESGLIMPIGEWVLRTACQQAKAWRAAGLPLSRMAVNISLVQFVHRSFPDLIAQILEEVDLEPAVLELEVTEALLMGDADNATKTLGRLKAIGVQLAIDDFGTGYSSLTRLREFPIDRLKIDRSFVHALGEAQDDKTIAVAVINMAESMHLKVIAEGVESGPQVHFLKDRHCDEVQGYYVSRPLAVSQAELFLRSYSAHVPGADDFLTVFKPAYGR